MNALLLLILLGSLFTSLYVVIPNFAPSDQQDIIQEWLGLGFNGLLFAIVLYQTSFQYMNVYAGILALVIALVVALSGVYWWIPTYIPKSKQVTVTKDMFTGLSMTVLLTNIMTQAVPVSFGGRRR